MPYRWLFILGFIIGALIYCLYLHCLNVERPMTAYEKMLRANPTGAGR